MGSVAWSSPPPGKWTRSVAKSISQFRRDIRILRKEIEKVALPAMRGFQAEVRKRARKGYKSTALGRALWGRGRTSNRSSSRPPLVLKTIRARLSGTQGGFIGGVSIRGIAALIETGGRIERHTIHGRPFLYFNPKGGGSLVRARTVRHPGAQVRKLPAVQSGMVRIRPIVERIMRHNLERLFKRVAL